MWTTARVDARCAKPARAGRLPLRAGASTTPTPTCSSQQANLLSAGPSPLRWFCIDAAAIPDIDYTGGETLRQLHGALAARDIRLVIAAALPAVVAELDRYGLTPELGDGAIFSSVDAAVAAFRQSDDRAG